MLEEQGHDHEPAVERPPAVLEALSDLEDEKVLSFCRVDSSQLSRARHATRCLADYHSAPGRDMSGCRMAPDKGGSDADPD